LKCLSCVLLLMVLLPAPVLAASRSARFLSLQGFSVHFKNAGERKAVHPTLGYEHSPNRTLGWQVGFFQDSFGKNASYLGFNYTPYRTRWLGKSVRLILAANIVRKQYLKGGEVETRIIPTPVIELGLYQNLSVNLTGSPQLDYGDNHHTNGVVFLQVKLKL